jgi:hypothetical protein
MVLVTFSKPGPEIHELQFTARTAIVGPTGVWVVSPAGKRVLIARQMGVAGWRIESSGSATHRVFPYFNVRELRP